MSDKTNLHMITPKVKRGIHQNLFCMSAAVHNKKVFSFFSFVKSITILSTARACLSELVLNDTHFSDRILNWERNKNRDRMSEWEWNKKIEWQRESEIKKAKEGEWKSGKEQESGEREREKERERKKVRS